MGRRGKQRKQLPNGHKEWKYEEEAFALYGEIRLEKVIEISQTD